MDHAQALTWRTAYYSAQEEADRLSELMLHKKRQTDFQSLSMKRIKYLVPDLP